jgi:hypothetical protein
MPEIMDHRKSERSENRLAEFSLNTYFITHPMFFIPHIKTR